MRRLITTLLLAITVFFSTFGADHYETCQSEGSFFSASTEGGSFENTALNSSIFEQEPSTPITHLNHVCHIGHCAFTLQSPKAIEGIAFLVTPRLLSTTQFKLGELPSEMLRPPSRV